MEKGNYRKWIPALIIGLILCLPVITWLLAGTSEPDRPAAVPSEPAEEGP